MLTGGVTVVTTTGGGAVVGVVTGLIGVVVRPLVPEMVIAPKGTEDPSATRFHFLNPAIVMIWGITTWSSGKPRRESGREKGSGNIPLPLVTGTNNVPVTEPTESAAYSVEVVVNAAVIFTLSTIVVRNVVVITAFVIVLMGNETPVGTLAENTEKASPGGRMVCP